MNNPDLGQIKIYQKAIRQVAETAAQEVSGVKAVGWRCFDTWGILLKFLGIAVTRIQSDKITKISIPISVSMQENAVNTAYEVQKQIINKVSSQLNIENVIVDVRVKKIEA
jgi:uncharacterized alkaline shock family protein YloU